MIDIAKLSRLYDVRELNETHADAILRLCEANTQYYAYCHAEPTTAQVLSDLRVAPPGVDASDKHYVGFYDGDSLAAVMDLVDGYPEPDMAYIGFFMMDRALQGRGIGSAVIGEVAACLKAWGRRSIRLAIARDNPQARHFWKKNGFTVVKEVDMGGWIALVADRTL